MPHGNAGGALLALQSASRTAKALKTTRISFRVAIDREARKWREQQCNRCGPAGAISNSFFHLPFRITGSSESTVSRTARLIAIDDSRSYSSH